MKRERKTYDPAFKRQAVELSKTRKNISELTREILNSKNLLIVS